jgi:mono/diheme cytochrome c family protein
MKRWFFVVAASFALGGCSCGNISSSYELQRMEVQPKYEAYEASPLFADGRAMRTPPQGTIPREAVVGNPARETGELNGALVADVQVPVTPELLALGKLRFEIVCATCHGVLGNGDSMVADNFPTRIPPSLVALTDKPAGFFYRAATYGFGVMPSFAGELNNEERWAVVAYIKALQLSQNQPIAAAPADVQHKLMEEKE